MGSVFAQPVAVLVGFALSVLPRRAKTARGFDSGTPASAHVLSGLAELGLALSALVLGLLDFAGDFHELTDGALAAGSVIPGGRAVGAGLMILLSYAIQPASLLWLTFVADGLLRAIDAGVNDGRRGVWVLELCDRIALELRGLAAGRAMAARLGPERPDEIVRPDESASGLLELYTVHDQPFFEQQVVRLDGAFFVIAARGLRQRGAHEARYYGFRPLKPGEVIRGTVVELGS